MTNPIATTNIRDFKMKQAQTGLNGMVCTSQPDAAKIGIEILKKGGNAIDAAIATAAAMTVVEPPMNGLGGDAFALIWHKGALYGLNGSGFAPEAVSVQALRSAGFNTMPATGWPAVTVPGVVSAWAQLAKRFGRFSLARCLEPAVDLADKGFAVTPIIAQIWAREYDKYQRVLPPDLFKVWEESFALPAKARAPLAGETWRQQDQAQTLAEIGQSSGESFYRGQLAKKIDRAARAGGGYLRLADLERYEASWVDPISVDYKGYTVHEIPPNGHGIVTLMALSILEQLDQGEKGEARRLHNQIEALKLAFSDGRHYITDPAEMKVSVEQLLDPAYARKRSALIGDQALWPAPGSLSAGGTIYLCTADGEGNLVSFIQSNYKGFGSGVVIPRTGIALNNRGRDFSFEPSAANLLKPGKKPYHTIIPGFLTKSGQPLGPFGVMGGMMQPQGHLQVITNLIDRGLDPQQALDAPRWQWQTGRTVGLEPVFREDLSRKLTEYGHEIERAADFLDFGRGQIILKKADNTFVGGSESRADGLCAAW